jgi:gluconolactonase
VKSTAGSTVTNLAYQPGGNWLYMTESETGCVLRAKLPAAGKGLFSHT